MRMRWLRPAWLALAGILGWLVGAGRLGAAFAQTATAISQSAATLDRTRLPMPLRG